MKEEQTIQSYWRNNPGSTFSPGIKIEKCLCGKLPIYHSSTGGFNIYGYYECKDCKIFATGRHQFPNVGIEGFGENENHKPKLFVVYRGEYNPENGWNNLIKELTK